MPYIFFGASKTFPLVVGFLSMLTVKTFGIGLQNPMKPEKDKYNNLVCASCKLIGAVNSARVFSTADHIQAVKGKRWGGRKYPDVSNEAKL